MQFMSLLEKGRDKALGCFEAQSKVRECILFEKSIAESP